MPTCYENHSKSWFLSGFEHWPMTPIGNGTISAKTIFCMHFI